MHPFEDSFHFDLSSVQHYRFVFMPLLMVLSFDSFLTRMYFFDVAGRALYFYGYGNTPRS